MFCEESSLPSMLNVLGFFFNAHVCSEVPRIDPRVDVMFEFVISVNTIQHLVHNGGGGGGVTPSSDTCSTVVIRWITVKCGGRTIGAASQDNVCAEPENYVRKQTRPLILESKPVLMMQSYAGLSPC